MYYPVETRITPLTTIRRDRLLPVRGEVLVQPGTMVNPTDVVARCEVPGDVQLMDVSRKLKLRRDRAEKYVRVSADDTILEGDILAAPAGFRGRFKNCRAPVNGRIVQVRSGMILIEAASQTFELRAHLKGEVANVMPERGVVISTVGSLIQGTWGSGGEAVGILKMLVDNPQKPLRARAIDVSCQGTLIVGGRIIDDQAFQPAIEAKVRGIIAGSASAELLPVLRTLPFPVLLTGGFGAFPMSETVFNLLHSNMGREVMLSTDTQTRWNVKHPEIVIPLRSDTEAPPAAPGPVPLQVGHQVRIARAPYLGSVGTVTLLPPLPQTVESGVRLSVAEVSLEDVGRVLIPLPNLELIR